MRSPTAFSRYLLVIAALVTAMIACNLQRQDDSNPDSKVTPEAQRPVVEILEPAEGARVLKGQAVPVRARATGSSGVTLVELRVNNLVVDSQVPAESLSPNLLEVLLDYTPDQSGTVTLAVTAYSNTIAGQPALRTINVVDSLESGTTGTTRTPQPAATATVYNPQCRARVNVGLNFRSGPGTDYDKLQTLNAGSEPPITGYAQRADGTWWQVLWGGQYGWISAAYATQLGNCAGLQLAPVPPSPTPQPSVTPQPTTSNATATTSLPDLVITELDGPRTIDLGSGGTAQGTYSIRIRNSGGQPSGQFNVGVALPNGTVQDLGLVALGPGQEVQIPAGGLVVTFDSPGIKRLLVTADTGNVIAESSEGNNQTYIDISVNPGPAATIEITVVSPPASSDNPQPDTSGGPVVSGGVSDGGVVVVGDGAASGAGGGGVVVESGGPAPVSVSSAGQMVEINSLAGHSGTVAGLAASPDGARLASASWDGTVQVWDAATGAPLVTLSGHTDRVVAVAFSPSGAQIASASWDGTARIWDAAGGQLLATLDHGAEVNSVSFSPDGARVATGGNGPSGGLVRVWDAASGALTSEIYTASPVSSVALNSASTVALAVTAGCDSAGGESGIWDATSGAQIASLTGHTGPVSQLTVGGGLIAGSGRTQGCAGNAAIWVWSAGNGALQTMIDQGSPADITALAFNPAGTRIAAASTDNTLRLYDAAGGSPLAAVTGDGGQITSVTFSANGSQIVSGGADSVLRVWGVP